MTSIQEPETFTRNQILTLVGLTFFAALLRLYRIDEWALWVDEAHTFRDVTSPPEMFWKSHVARYPLSYLMLRGMLPELPSMGEGWLRLPFAFFGILSIPALAMVGRNIVGTRAAVVGALLLAVSPWHLYWSQNVRSYPIMLFFALMSAAGFFGAVRKKSFLLLVASMLGTLIAGLCHPSGYMPFAAFCAYGYVFVRRQAKAGSSFARYMPWIGAVVLLLLGVILYPNLAYFQKAKPDTSIVHFGTTLAYFVGLPLFVAASGGVLLLWHKHRNAAGFLGAWALVPPLVLAVVSAVLFKVTAQYCLASLPAFCLLAGVLTIELTEALKVQGWQRQFLRAAVPAILVLQMLGQDMLYFAVRHGERPKWRDAAQYVQHQSKTPVYLLTTNQPGMQFYMCPEKFWGEPNRKNLKIVSIEASRIQESGGPEPYIEEQFVKAKRMGATIYCILTEPELMEKDPTGGLNRWMRESGRQVLRLPGWTGPKDMVVLVYKMDMPAD